MHSLANRKCENAIRNNTKSELLVDCCTGRCFLCEEVGDENPLSRCLNLYENAQDKIIVETENFVVFPDISPIVPGHCLLLTKEHLTSFAQIPTQNWIELQYIKRRAAAFVRREFSPPFLFEHGSVPGKRGSGACIEHAHIHLIPAQVPVVHWLQYYSKTRIQCKTIDMPEALKGINDTYLYYEDQKGQGCIVKNPEVAPPQQFIRRVVAENCSISNWDWKKAL